jgi:hypothetical protein
VIQQREPKSSDQQSQIWKPVLCIVLTAALATLPMLLRGTSCGHDFNFHLLSWLEVARARHSGVWYPHWAHDANYGAGEPRFVFYPPASWMLGAFLGSITSWTLAPPLFVFVALIASGWSMFCLASEWLPARTATLAACFYLANPYALFVSYERSAFGELLAGVWIPLILLFATSKSRSIFALSLAVAAVWLTDAPAAVIASYTLAVVALAMMWAERKAWPGLRAAGGMLFGLGLAAFYLVPAANEQRWVEIGRVVLSGLRVEDSFLFERTGESFHDQVLHTASWILLVAIAIAAIAFWLSRRNRDSGASLRFSLGILLLLASFLQFRFSAAIWHYVPKLRYVQFPWRWLVVIEAAACLLTGMAIDSFSSGALPLPGGGARGRFTKISVKAVMPVAILATGIVLTVVVASRIFFQTCDDEDAPAAQLAAFQSGEGVEGTDEYTPAGADNSEIQQGLPFLRLVRSAHDDTADSSHGENPPWQPPPDASKLVSVPVSIQMKKRNAESWTIHFESNKPANEPGYAVLRLMDYPAWQVTLNGSPIRGRPSREDGLMTLPIRSGSNVIDVRWKITQDAIAGRAVSAIALALLIAFEVAVRKTPTGIISSPP